MQTATNKIYKTFDQWAKKTFTKDELKDIANHGADGGFHSITYTSECVNLHDLYQKELWNMLYEDSQDYGYDNIPAFMSTWIRKDMLNDLDQMKNMIIWYAVEKIAHEVTND